VENLQRPIESLKRWRWLVGALTLLAMLAAIAIAASKSTTYSATSTVVVGSAATQSTTGRSPDQDAVLAAGYIPQLNSPSFQNSLKEQGKVADGVSISAAPVALSPFIDITATASSPAEAIAAADAISKGFASYTLNQFNSIVSDRLDIPRQRLKEIAAQIAADQDKLAGGGLSGSDAAAVRGEIDALRAEATGLTANLQNQAGVTGNPNLAGVYHLADGAVTNKASIARNAILGLVGGLLLGSAIALLLGALELRLRSASDVRRRLELPLIGSVTSGRGPLQDARRAEDFKTLASSISVLKPPVASVAVVSPSDGEGKSMVAENLARWRAAQGGRVILIKADMRDRSTIGRANGGERAGLADLLNGGARSDIRNYMVETDYPGLWVIPSGGGADDPYTLFSSDRVSDVIAQACVHADMVIVDTPALLGAAEGQVLSAGTDGSVLVVDSTSTQPGAALEARDVLRRSGSNILGVVLNRVPKSSAVFS
jgi:capsular exopolysaccharide synthesis family protein